MRDNKILGLFFSSFEPVFKSWIREALNEKEQEYIKREGCDSIENHGKKLTISQLSNYLPENPARQTIYGWVCHRKIPFQKHGSRLFFVKSKIDKWLENGRVMSLLKELED